MTKYFFMDFNTETKKFFKSKLEPLILNGKTGPWIVGYEPLNGWPLTALQEIFDSNMEDLYLESRKVIEGLEAALSSL